MTDSASDGMFHYTTLGGVEVVVPLNLNREQWKLYESVPDNMGPNEAWDFFEAMGVTGLGVLDIQRLANGWGIALGEALGLTLGESEGSTEPSTDPTAKPLRSTSGGSSKSRSQKSAA